MPQKVSEFMTRAPITLPLEANLAEAAQIMRDRGIGDVLVTADGELCGVLTDRDIVVRAVADNREPDRTAVSEVCSAGVVTLSPDDDTAIAAELMRRHAIRRLPVVEKGIVVGIVSLGDLAIEQDDESALSEISRAVSNL